MTRVKRGVNVRARHKKVLEQSKGFIGRASSSYRVAVQRLSKALTYEYRDRRRNRRELKSLWIERINSSVRLYGLNYSQFINCLKDSQILVNRKMLYTLALSEPLTFEAIVKSQCAQG